MLLSASLLIVACNATDDVPTEGDLSSVESGVFVLCEGNFNSGNASLSYYNPTTKTVENGVFRRVNDRKLGDTGQSITISDGTAYIAVENSGIVWGIDAETFKVKGQLVASSETKITNPRYVHIVNAEKAYVTDLYSHYINIFNPKTFAYKGAIDVSQVANLGYCSTEEMVQYGDEVFVNCWSYSNKLLVIDAKKDELCDSIILPSWQPKSMKLDKHGKLWVITDGGYSSGGESFKNELPHLYRIDAKTREIELDQVLESDEANVQLAMNGKSDVVYIINNDIYRMSVTDNNMSKVPFILAPVDENGKRHKLYGIGVDPKTDDIYVADAVDYRQAGMAYRYSSSGTLLDQFKVGINPNGFAFSGSVSSQIVPDKGTDDFDALFSRTLVSKVFEYMPAPGHQVNGYSVVGDFIRDGATMEEACDSVLSKWKNQFMISLGGQGGYVVAGFDHNVLNSNGDFDIAIKGNPYSYQSEPGIVWVMKDENGDGLPNDTWYELKGSEYGTENETLNYAITYYKPTAPHSDIEWIDNQGGSGVIPYMSDWNTHDSYWQDWLPTELDADGRECHTFYGSRLKDTHTYEDGYTYEPPFAWGYADNDGSDYCNYAAFAPGKRLGYFKISNAVDANGKPANLEYINFVKVQTAQTGCSPNLGEISTEVYGIWDCHAK